jgi:glutamate-1-semialdehyde 2,1-aminomutase
MVFSRIFGKTSRPVEPPSDVESEIESDDADDAEPTEVDDGQEDYAARARRVIVGGASTGSKRPGTMYGGGDDVGPTHFVRAAGCHLVTADGDTLVDCTMALGSVALGYAEPELTRAVIETIASGPVSGLSPVLEVEVAERFCAAVPCAERVQFVKTGADAVSAAIRIARAHTGRDHVVGCGYFGWHDWSATSAGVPAATKALYHPVPFDDVAALERAANDIGGDLAAIVIEPVIERLPSKEWALTARSLCDRHGAVLIFDEIKTGFRVATGGYQQYAEVVPDLAAFGKAMANGFPIGAVCGHASLMEIADGKTWISSTLASESASLAATIAVLAWHDKVDICASLWSIGKEMRESVDTALQASGLGGVTVAGIDPMWLLRFDAAEREGAFLRAAVRHGALFKRGAYNFAAMAHDDDAIREIESAASAAFVELREREER